MYVKKTWARRTKNRERDAAAASGARFYVIDVPCSRGHRSERYTQSGICVECVRNHYAARATGAARRTPRQQVYVLETQHAIKIGVAKRVADRLQVTRTHCPFPVTVVFCTDPMDAVQARQIEARVCHAYRERRLQGSWFTVAADAAVQLIQKECMFV